MIRQKNKDKVARGNSTKSQYRRKNPEKAKAHRLIAKALAAKKLLRPHNCAGCNASAEEILGEVDKDGEAPVVSRLEQKMQRAQQQRHQSWEGMGLEANFEFGNRGLVLDKKNRYVIQYHHEDYARPFWVVALCPTCHRSIHNHGPDSLDNPLPTVKMDAAERACRSLAVQEGVMLRGPTPIPCRET